ncbi:MAG: hypothetical protein IT560_08985 [Alphaproteobacteria bacterium]|nr:hypothetical protein [Alphaproteobacteria bacterium]
MKKAVQITARGFPPVSTLRPADARACFCREAAETVLKNSPIHSLNQPDSYKCAKAGSIIYLTYCTARVRVFFRSSATFRQSGLNVSRLSSFRRSQNTADHPSGPLIVKRDQPATRRRARRAAFAAFNLKRRKT